MKNIHLLLTLLTSALSFASFSQTCLGDDVSACAGTPVTIELCNQGGGVNNPVISLSNPQSYTLGDDDFTPAINIGFPFDFYGNSYSQVVVGDNGIVSFDVSQAGGYCSWVVTALPGATTSSWNSILTPWQDLYMPNGGTIYTETVGTAPNRMFVIFYDGLSMFGSQCGASNLCFTGSVILYETSNKVETHLSNKTVCTGWGSGLASHGIQNIDGTIAHVVPGRNNSVWNAQNDSWEFVPTSPTNYNVNNIPFTIVTTPNGGGLVWQDTQGNSYPYNNGSVTVLAPNPAVSPLGIFVSSSTCGTGVGAVSDTSWITSLTSSVSINVVDDMCSASIGQVTATPTSGTGPYTYNWPTLGNNPNQTVTGLPAGTYQVQMTDGNGCASSATATVGDTPATFSGTTTVVSCPGGNDGTAFAEMVPVIGNLTYQWDDPAMQTTQTATGLTAGQYTCVITSDIGCSGTVVVDVTEIPGMIANVVSTSDATCNSGNNGVIEIAVTQGTPPYTYSWDNSSSTSNIANDLYAGTHTCTITDANGCIITITETISEPPALNIVSVTPDTQICPEDDIQLTVVGSGGSSPYIFTWTSNGAQIGTGDTITVDPDVTNTVYCVELSEQCGSPTDQECTTITFPTPIQPNALPDEASKCVPNSFEIANTSSNRGEIATTYWEFGDDPAYNELVNGDDTVSHYYTTVGTFDVTMTVTSIYGCVYRDTIKDLIEVLPSPTARFLFEDNPTTIFETTVKLHDASTSDVISWEWTAPTATPKSSTSVNPVFEYPEDIGTHEIRLLVTTQDGCVDSVTHLLEIVDDILFFAPNTFTPDDDEFNQKWKYSVKGIDPYDFELLIFNRWGQLVWESHDPTVAWDGTYKGKPVQAGTYQWVARVKSPYKDYRRTFTGAVTLMK